MILDTKLHPIYLLHGWKCRLNEPIIMHSYQCLDEPNTEGQCLKVEDGLVEF